MRGITRALVSSLFVAALAVAPVVAEDDSLSYGSGGSTWNDVSSPAVEGADVRWAVGDSGKLFKTVDGDTTTRSVIGRGQFDLCGVSFADAKHGWIVGNKREDPGQGIGVVFRTTTGGDGPEAWTATFPAVRPGITVPFLKVQAVDAMRVWVTCGDGYALRSNDGGMNWLVVSKHPTSDTGGQTRSQGASR